MEHIVIEKIQGGDEKLREQFICDYKPFILKSVSKFCGRFIEYENDEEFSIGLIAFNEAIDGYSTDKGSSFIGFAGQVIKRRLIDYLRKNKKDMENTFTDFSEDKEGKLVTMMNENVLRKEFVKLDISDEIMSLSMELNRFHISFQDLVSSAPKHTDSRLLCISLAKYIVENPDIFAKLERTKNLPAADIAKIENVSKRTIGKNRKYIIALCLILRSELEIMKNYIAEAEKGGRMNG